jgi:hypothetical protein
MTNFSAASFVKRYVELVWRYSTSQSILRPLQRTLQKAHDMLDNRAFLHHYQKFGLEESAFRDRFADMAQVVHNYQSM